MCNITESFTIAGFVELLDTSYAVVLCTFNEMSYTLSAAGRIRTFHPLAYARRTNEKMPHTAGQKTDQPCGALLIYHLLMILPYIWSFSSS